MATPITSSKQQGIKYYDNILITHEEITLSPAHIEFARSFILARIAPCPGTLFINERDTPSGYFIEVTKYPPSFAAKIAIDPAFLALGWTLLAPLDASRI